MDDIKRKILVSVDDGSVLDMDLADMLHKYKIPAIFYIAPTYSDLQAHQIRCLAGVGNCELSRKLDGLFEIGSHTMTHPPDMKTLSDKQLKEELVESKKFLEMLIQGKKKVTKFCYPKGKFDKRVKKAVKKAGYLEARTVRSLSIEFPEDPFEIETTVHAHPEKYQDSKTPVELRGKSWKEIADILLDKVIKEGGRFELWMHSWELEKYNQWEFLEDTFAYMDDKMSSIDYPRLI